MAERQGFKTRFKAIFPSLREKLSERKALPCDSRFRSFSRTFARKLRSKNPQPTEIAAYLLEQCYGNIATHIYLEPSPNNHRQLFFRIGDTLRRAMVLNNTDGEVLFSCLQKAATPLSSGLFQVQEGEISLDTSIETKQFSLFFIPRESSASVTIQLKEQDQSAKQELPANRPPKAPNIRKKIIIWQMGKVGSLSIYNSLKPYSTPCRWEHFKTFPDDRWPVHNNLIQTHSVDLLYNLLHHSDEEFVIISLVRDLLARNISSVFQSMNFTEEWRNQYFIATQKEFQKLPYEKQEQELTKQLRIMNHDSSILNWYDNLLRSHFYYPDVDKYVIDIYGRPFNQEKGYQIYQSKTPRIQMMVIRLEDLNTLETELGDFMGIDTFRLLQTNISGKKWYQPVYQKFKQRYCPSEEELNIVYNSKFMKYFYSQRQIKHFIQNWKKP